jgi:hypothetical protein
VLLTRNSLFDTLAVRLTERNRDEISRKRCKCKSNKSELMTLSCNRQPAKEAVLRSNQSMRRCMVLGEFFNPRQAPKDKPLVQQRVPKLQENAVYS